MSQENLFERRDVEFPSAGVLCRAWHYLPTKPANTPTPCIVMAHGLGSTKEAGLEPYAEHFAAAGFQVLVFDYRHFGASDGEPRQLLRVSKQLVDWRAAVDYARSLKDVDVKKVALWGSSFSGGHVVTTAANDANIAAISAQGPMVDGRAAVLGMLGYAGLWHVLKLSAYGIADQVKALFGLSPVTVPITAPPGQLAAMSSHDAHTGYAAIQPSDWKNEMTARMALTLALYRPTSHAHKVTCPVLILACNKDTVAPASAAVKLAKKLGDQARLKQYDIGHFDVYVGEDFKRGVAEQTAFFKQTLL